MDVQYEIKNGQLYWKSGGISLTFNPNTLPSYLQDNNNVYAILKLPDGLKVQQNGDPFHCLIIPSGPMTSADYLNALSLLTNDNSGTYIVQVTKT